MEEFQRQKRHILVETAKLNRRKYIITDNIVTKSNYIA